MAHYDGNGNFYYVEDSPAVGQLGKLRLPECTDFTVVVGGEVLRQGSDGPLGPVQAPVAMIGWVGHSFNVVAIRGSLPETEQKKGGRSAPASFSGIRP